MPATSRSLMVLSLLLAACGGGGGGGGGSGAPRLLSATFTGAGSTPASGDSLILFFDADVALLAGQLFNDSDVAITGGGSLGTVTVPPAALSARAVRITLGAGTTFTPGTTAIDIASGNDAVVSGAGVRAGPAQLRTIALGDGSFPTLANLTVNGIADSLNGRGAAGGTLQVPTTGFTIDVTATDAQSAIDTSRTVVVASVDVGSSAGTVRAGANLAPALSLGTNGATQTFTVPASTVFPAGAVSVAAYVIDASGMPSTAGSFSFTTIPANDSIRPFETNVNASQVWFLDLSRDLESYTFVGGGGQTITVTAGANGRADLFDLFLIMGLHGSDAAVNDTVANAFRQQVLAQLGVLHGGANIQFTFTSPGSFPGGSQVAYASHGFSQICVAGAENASGASGILGVALLDENNKFQDNDSLTDFGGTQRLGVFVHTLASLGFRPPGSSLFRLTYDPFAPGMAGTPIGNDGGDAARLITPTDARGLAIANAINRLARFVAVVVAHECGHSVGLVANGAMPVGLYGGLPAFFPGSTSGHIQNSDFPAGAQNVMAPGIDFVAAQSTNTTFNTLNRAYLLERALYNFVP